MLNRQSIVGASSQSQGRLYSVSSRRAVFYQIQEQSELSPDKSIKGDLEEITKYFLRFWQAPSVVKALNVLSHYEEKEGLTSLHKKYGHWCPPTELVQVLNKPLPSATSLANSKEARKLKFVMKMLGCSFHESRPYKQFCKARSIRQKRMWWYRYMRPESEENEDVCEPICPTRLKRLSRFFPNSFSQQNGLMYFNHKPVSFNKTKGVYYIGKTPDGEDDDDEDD